MVPPITMRREGAFQKIIRLPPERIPNIIRKVAENNPITVAKSI